MIKIDQALEAIKELKELAESADFKADLQAIKNLKGLTPAEKVEAVKELEPVILPLAKLVKAFTGDKIDVLVDDVVEALTALFGDEEEEEVEGAAV